MANDEAPTPPTPAPPLPKGIKAGFTAAVHENGSCEVVFLEGSSAFDLLALLGLANIKILDAVRDFEKAAKQREADARTPYGRAKQRLKAIVSKKERKRLEALAKQANAAAASQNTTSTPPAAPVELHAVPDQRAEQIAGNGANGTNPAA